MYSQLWLLRMLQMYSTVGRTKTSQCRCNMYDWWVKGKLHPLSHMKSGSLGQYQRSTCEFRDNAGHLRAGANRASATRPTIPHRMFNCPLISEHPEHILFLSAAAR
jgi:hypothetical protein